MKDIHFQIENFKATDASDVDIICVEALEHLNEIISKSIVTINNEQQNWKIRIQFDWKENNEIKEADFLYVQETNMLFFRSHNQWAAFDILNKTIKRHESSQWAPHITRKENYILIEDDLNAESTRLSAERIHSVPIDPPTEAIEFEDRIEYNSPVYGRQILKVK
jgi:hypothetical protein